MIDVIIERAIEGVGHIAARRKKIIERDISHRDLMELLRTVPPGTNIEVTYINSMATKPEQITDPSRLIEIVSPRFSPTMPGYTHFHGEYLVYANHHSEVHVIDASQSLSPNGYKHEHVRMRYALKKQG